MRRRPITLDHRARGCGHADRLRGRSDDETPDAASETTTAEESPREETPAEEMSTDLATAETSLGTIVVDGNGMTAYYFLKDAKDSGTSACSGDCPTAWPPITTESDTPTVEGVTGEVGTITGTDGVEQITIDGRPIYTFAQDTAPGRRQRSGRQRRLVRHRAGRLRDRPTDTGTGRRSAVVARPSAARQPTSLRGSVSTLRTFPSGSANQAALIAPSDRTPSVHVASPGRSNVWNSIPRPAARRPRRRTRRRKLERDPRRLVRAGVGGRVHEEPAVGRAVDDAVGHLGPLVNPSVPS